MKKFNGFWTYIAVNSALLLIAESFVWIVDIKFRMTGMIGMISAFFAIPLLFYCLALMPLIHIVLIINAFLKQDNLDKKNFWKISIIFTLNLLLNIFAGFTAPAFLLAGMT